MKIDQKINVSNYHCMSHGIFRNAIASTVGSPLPPKHHAIEVIPSQDCPRKT
jgi:hypothetical protein